MPKVFVASFYSTMSPHIRGEGAAGRCGGNGIGMGSRVVQLLGWGILVVLLLRVDGISPDVAFEEDTGSGHREEVIINKVNITQLSADQAAMQWTDEGGETEGVTYSVIVVAHGPHRSNLFRDRQRVKAFSTVGMNTVSVQFASPFPPAPFSNDSSAGPFLIRHPDGVDKRVRVILPLDISGSSSQVSHVQAACEDPSETTIMKVVDETCHLGHDLPGWVPDACDSNIARVYPFNSPGEETPQPYVPLGPRDTFPFVDEARRTPASNRPMLFNLMVTSKTSPRRQEVIEIANNYTLENPEVSCLTPSSSRKLSPDDWQNLLLDSQFTVAPGGHNAETYRMWEALESGSIPIVSRTDYTDPVYSKKGITCGPGGVAWNTVAASPFAREVSVNGWRELPALLDRLRREPPDYLEKLQAECIKWYSTVMTQTYLSMLNFGQGFDLWPQDGPIVSGFEDSGDP